MKENLQSVLLFIILVVVIGNAVDSVIQFIGRESTIEVTDA